MTEVERITDPDRIVFPNLHIDVSVDSTAFSAFGFEIKWYAVIISFGLLLAMIYCFPRMKKFGIDPDRAIDAVIAGVLGGMIGARAYYVAFRWEQYAGNLKAILNFRNGGLAIYGGIIGAILFGGIMCKIRKVKFLPMLDITGMGFLIGQGIGRWGNFVNQEAFGTNTDCLFAMTGGTVQNTIINEVSNPSSSMYGTSMSELYGVHPCFLYESVWCLAGFLILALFSKHRKFDGQLFLIYLTWYGMGRFIIEGFRTDSLMFGNIRVSQLLALLCVITATAVHIAVLMRAKHKGEPFVLYCNTEESKELIRESEEKYNKNNKNNKENKDNGTDN